MSVFSTHLLSPSVSWRNAGLYLGMAFGPTQRPVPPGMKQVLAPLWNMEHRRRCHVKLVLLFVKINEK